MAFGNQTDGTAETDHAARAALWREIRLAAEQLSGQCTVYLSDRPNPAGRVVQQAHLREDVLTWKLVEALSLLSILCKADKVFTENIVNILGKTGRVHVREDGVSRWIWAQHGVQGLESTLAGRPDLIVTTNDAPPTSETIHRVVESKCRKRFGAHDIRAEFGKAQDLHVRSYLIWTFYTPSDYLVAGAKTLNLDLQALGFDTKYRGVLVDQPGVLLAHVANALDQSRREERFAMGILQAGQETPEKLLGSDPG